MRAPLVLHRKPRQYEENIVPRRFADWDFKRVLEPLEHEPNHFFLVRVPFVPHLREGGRVKETALAAVIPACGR